MIRYLLHRRYSITIVVVLALLFSQLALASYVCPGSADEAAAAGVMEMAAGVPCEGMAMTPDEDQSVLCHQHCLNAPQSFDPVQVPAVSLPAIVQVLVIPSFVGDAMPATNAYASAREARPPPDPLFLSTLRLRV
jgi:hypothetical protein